MRRHLDVLARHCEDIGRPYEAIEKTLGTRLDVGETSEEFIRRCAAAAAIGIEHLVVITSGLWTSEKLAAAAIPEARVIAPVTNPGRSSAG